MINIFEPSLGQEELDALKEVFASNWIGRGEHVLRFEREFAASLQVDAAHFTTTNSCTEAIFLAADLFNFGPGNEIIVPAVSFIAVGNAIVARGATMVLCDVDSRSLNATPELIEGKITPRTRAVFVNHYGGIACDMEPIMALCRERGIAVIEDAACAPRSFYRGRAVGTIGDMGMWSFDAMKIVCTGDGGMIYLRDPEQLVEAKEQLYMGLPNRQTSGIDSAACGASSWWQFEINRPGRRAIMNNIAGAIGVAQMKKLPGFLARRRQIHEHYERELGCLGWLALPPAIPSDCVSSYYFFWVQLARRNDLALALKRKGVYSTFRYWPLHRVDYFGLMGERLPNADLASERTLNLPIHQSLSDHDVNLIVETIREFGRSNGL